MSFEWAAVVILHGCARPPDERDQVLYTTSPVGIEPRPAPFQPDLPHVGTLPPDPACPSEAPADPCVPRPPIVECSLAAVPATNPGAVVLAPTVSLGRIDGDGGFGFYNNLGSAATRLGDPDADGFHAFAVFEESHYGYGALHVYDGALGTATPATTILGRDNVGRVSGEDLTATDLDSPTPTLWALDRPGFDPDVWSFVTPLPAGVVDPGAVGGVAIHAYTNASNWRISAGDVTGDGVDDLALTTSTYAAAAPVWWEPGLVHVLSGPFPVDRTVPDDDHVTVVPEVSDPPNLRAANGGSPAIIPDIDGDGADDLLVGNMEYDYWGETYDIWNMTGSAFLYTDIASRSGVQGLGTENALLVGTCDSLLDGYWQASVGDVTADGRPDVGLGSSELDLPGRMHAGAVFILSKLDEVCGVTEIVHATDTIILGAEAGDRLRSSGRLGDLDGDGFDDLVVGAPHAGCCGKIYLFRGPVCGTIDAADADLTVEGVGLDVFFGSEIEPAGDFDGDGIDDLLVGAPSSEWGGPAAGALYVLSGAMLLSEMRL